MPEKNGLMTAEDAVEFRGILTNLGSKYDDAISEVKKFGGVTSETKETIGKIEIRIVELQDKYAEEAKKNREQVDKLEEILAQRPTVETPVKSLGFQLVEHPDFLEGIKSAKGKHSINVGLKWPETKAAEISGYSSTFFPQVLNSVVALPEQPFGVRQLVPQGRTTSGNIQYYRVVSETNAAAPVAELAAKPQSDLTLDPQNALVETIAHYFKISKQCYDDLPFMASLINSRGIYMLKIKEDNQLLNGSGVSPQLQGFNTVAGAATAPPAGSNLVDAIGVSTFQLAGAGYIPDGVVVNPVDWGAVALQKNQFGQYVYANPLEFSPNSRIWGQRIVMSANQAAGTFLNGAFQGNSMIVDREEVNVQVANYDTDDFTKNRLTVLIEERLANLIFDTGAFKKGTVPVAAPGEAAATSRKRE